MSPKKPLIATNVDSIILEKLRALAEVRGVTLRALAADVLTSACDERSSEISGRSPANVTDAPEKRPGRNPSADQITTVLAIPKARLAGFAASDPLNINGRDGWSPLDSGSVPDPRLHFLLLLTELRLVSMTALWKSLVREGMAEAELHAPVEESSELKEGNADAPA